MTGDELRAALARLELTQEQGATVLRVSSPARVSDWCTGLRAVPEYIAAHVDTLLRLRVAAPRAFRRLIAARLAG